jgi:Kef-type K+ transport system membrane component KefB
MRARLRTRGSEVEGQSRDAVRMDFSLWLIAIGVLLVVIHASSHVVARLPLSPAIVYFLFGMAIGPWGFDWVRLDPTDIRY